MVVLAGIVRVGIVKAFFSGVGMRVNMHRAIAMAVDVEVNAIPRQADQHPGAQADQHDADEKFQPGGQLFRHGDAEQHHGSADREQGCRMADAPDHPVGDDPPDRAFGAGQAGHGRHMVGLEGMAQADQKSEEKYFDHGYAGACLGGDPSNYRSRTWAREEPRGEPVVDSADRARMW